ncbi:MAG TPA: hypothetical protein VHU80_12345 [Polyangiaceae bacterium]|jgi:hypothetical protein|nr:hypothetical protein [Polyangiaceae bacterium]
MIRRRKSVDWEGILPPEDVIYVWQQIRPDEWYPMTTFERLGLAILDHLDGATLDAVRLWGRFSAQQFDGGQDGIVVPGEPIESLMRLRVVRRTLFDFPAFDIPMLTSGHARVTITYLMAPRAEEAACHQTMGFCEGVVSLAGGTNVRAEFGERAWRGDSRTSFDLEWDH